MKCERCGDMPLTQWWDEKDLIFNVEMCPACSSVTDPSSLARLKEALKKVGDKWKQNRKTQTQR